MPPLRNLLATLALLASPFAQAQQAPAAAVKTPPSACAGSEHHQFDFWIGDWIVSGGPDGKTHQGNNTIKRVSSGCALLEHWRNPSGGEGMSLNAYDAGKREWTQFWIGADGVILRLHGGLQGGAMVMRGELPKAGGGGVQLQRITWTPKDDGSVEQRWDVSDDDGKSWSVSFLGIYRRTTTDAQP